jgi:hypothetical protein
VWLPSLVMLFSVNARSSESETKELPPVQLSTDRTVRHSAFAVHHGWLTVHCCPLLQARVLYDKLADLYSIIVVIEHLETAYVRDVLTDKE